MGKRKRLVTALFAIVLVAGVGALIIEAQSKLLRRFIDDVIYDNRNHYLSCQQLPPLSEVEKVVGEHQDVIRHIEQVSPGHVGVEIHSPCPGKGDIVFWYGGHQDRLTVEGIIGSRTFYGIPYRLHNR